MNKLDIHGDQLYEQIFENGYDSCKICKMHWTKTGICNNCREYSTLTRCSQFIIISIVSLFTFLVIIMISRS